MAGDRSGAGIRRDEALQLARSLRKEPAFNRITVAGEDDLAASSASKTLTLAAGSGISITTNATTGIATITSTASGGGATFGTATIDFGAFPGSNEASVAVTGQTSILGTSKVDVFIMGSDTTADHTANDHRYAALLLGFSATTPDVGVGFTIHGRCLDKMQGTFSVRWRWS